MLKNSTHKEKFLLLKEWMPSIVESIKKDLRNDHLKRDWMFAKKYFGGQNVNKLSMGELAAGYYEAIENSDSSEDIGEFIVSRWLLKHMDMYHYFEENLRKISPDFYEIEELDHSAAQHLMENAVVEFGAVKTYLFSVMNAVVFPKDIFSKLAEKARHERDTFLEAAKEEEEKLSFEQMKRSYEQQIARLTDKYEKKLIGFEKKYLQDMDVLRKQVSTLQKKLTRVESEV